MTMDGPARDTSAGLPPSPEGAADRDLVARALAGDHDARGELAAQLESVPRIVRALQRASGSFVAAHDQADVEQDCVALVWRKLPAFEGRSRLATWIYRVVSFELRNALRRVARGRRAVAEAPERREAASGGDDPSGRLVPLAVEECLARLEPTPMRIVRMRHWDERSFAEIATALGMKTSQAKSHYYRALQRLHALLGEAGTEAVRR